MDSSILFKDEVNANGKAKESEVEAGSTRRSNDSPGQEDRSIEIIRHETFPENGSIQKLYLRENTREVTRDGTFEISSLDDRPEKIDASLSFTRASQTQNIENDSDTHVSLQKVMEEKKNIEKMYKELEKRNCELEDQLKSMDCSLSCLKAEGDKEVACLKEALEKAKKEVHLASRSKDLALDLAKQSRDQTDSIKANRAAIAEEVNVVKCHNTKLQCECEQLKCKLKELKQKGEKKCSDVDGKLAQMKSSAKQKELALEKTVCELTNQVEAQKKRICDLTLVCTKQRDLLRENENCISTKIVQLNEAGDKIQSTNCRCKQLEEQIENLQCRLNEEMNDRENLEGQLEQRQDNCNCELLIKNKIIEDQIETIKKLKALLQDGEKMAHEAAGEFESLRDELHCLKKVNKSLRLTLEEVEEEINEENVLCERCNALEIEMSNLEEQKAKAIKTAKLAATKLCKTSAEYERRIECEKRRTEFLNQVMQQQDHEIQLLKKEILYVKEFRSHKSNCCMDQR